MSCKFIWRCYTLLGSLVKAERTGLRVHARSDLDRRSFDHSFGRLHDQGMRSLVADVNPETLTAHSHPGPAIDSLPLIRSTIRIF